MPPPCLDHFPLRASLRDAATRLYKIAEEEEGTAAHLFRLAARHYEAAAAEAVAASQAEMRAVDAIRRREEQKAKGEGEKGKKP